MITKQTYFRRATNLAQEIARLAPRALRSNRTNRQGSSKSVQKIRPTQADSKPPTTLPFWVIFTIHNTRDPSRVLEFVLERSAFYPPFVTVTIFIRKTCLPFVKCVRSEVKSDALKSTISQS